MKTMKKTAKRILFFTLLTVACLCLFIGCKAKKETVRTLVDWENSTEEIAYGEEYRLTTTTTDNVGNLVDVFAQVKTGENASVNTDGNTFVATDKSGYTITYTAVLEEAVYTKTTTLKVAAAKPIISVGLGFERVYTGSPFTLPAFTAYDYFDGDVSDTVQVKLFKAEGDEDLNYDGNGSYTFTQAGEYYALATAENENGVKSQLKQPFTVIDSATLSPYLIQIDKNNYTQFTTSGTKKFITKDGWAEKGLTGSYTGNAIYFRTAGGAYATIPNEIANRDLSMYTHLSVWITVDPFTAENTISDSAYVNLIVSTQDRLLNYVDGGTTFNKASAGEWREYLIPIADVIAYANGKTQLEFIYASASGINSTVRPNIYVGDVCFIKYQATQIPPLSEGALAWYDNTNDAEKASSLVNVSALSITGNYTGEQAISFKPYNKREARLSLEWQYYDLTQFTHLSFKVACDSYTAQTGYLQYGNGTTVIGGQSFSAATSGQWIEYRIPIATVLSSYQTYGHVKLLCITLSGNFTMAEGNSADRPNVYIGDVQLISVKE